MQAKFRVPLLASGFIALTFSIAGKNSGKTIPGRPATKSVIDTESRPWYHYIKDEMPRPKIPQVKQFQLSNGIQVYYLFSENVPLVHAQIMLEGGGFEVPDEKLGLNGLWGETVVFSGSQEFDRDKLSGYLENRASTFSFSAGMERSSFNINSMAHYFANDLTKLFSVLQNPRLAGEDFELLKTRILKEFERRDENPAKWASLGMMQMFWGGTLRGRYATMRSVKNLKAADLADWQKKVWRGERLSVAVTGAIKEDALKTLLESTLGKMSRDEKKRPDLKTMHVLPTLKANTLRILPRDIPQTTVVYKAPGMKHNDADYYALRIFDFLLGGDSFNSYLTQKIRTEKGWAYSVYSTFETDDFTGTLMLFTQTANMNLPDVIGAIDEILAKPEDFVTGEKIEEAKLSLKNKFVFLFENPVQYMKLFLQLKWDGLPESYLPDYAKYLSQVTEADVLRVAKKYYRPENFTVLLCGPGDIYSKKSTLRPDTASVLEIEK
jgi:zinc protease